MSHTASVTKNDKSSTTTEPQPDRGLANLAKPLLQIISPAMRAAGWIESRFQEQRQSRKDEEARMSRAELHSEDLRLGELIGPSSAMKSAGRFASIILELVSSHHAPIVGVAASGRKGMEIRTMVGYLDKALGVSSWKFFQLFGLSDQSALVLMQLQETSKGMSRRFTAQQWGAFLNELKALDAQWKLSQITTKGEYRRYYSVEGPKKIKAIIDAGGEFVQRENTKLTPIEFDVVSTLKYSANNQLPSYRVLADQANLKLDVFMYTLNSFLEKVDLKATERIVKR